MGKFGRKIQEYEVYERIGKGGFAVVYRGKCKNTRMEVAIKMIDKKQIKERGLQSRVNQEAEIHYQLKHPSILELYEFFEDSSYVYLVLELCHNGELQHYLKVTNSALSEPEACTITKQVVEGLLFLHKHKIMHRDMKLANLLLTREMNVKIADFGLATQLKYPGEKHMTMCGTPNYISPEVATRASHGLETDVWSLGIMLYTCLVGKHPFDSDHGLMSTMTLVATKEVEFPPYISLSPEAKDLIKSLLQKNPKDRISLKNILQHKFILRGQENSISGQMKRCISYDSGVASASYATSQPYNSFSHTAFPSTIKSGSFQNARPVSPNSRNFSSTNTGYSEPVGFSAYSQGTGHVCPSQSQSLHRLENEQPPLHHSLTNRFIPCPSAPPSFSGNDCGSIAAKHSGICIQNSCSHTWKQCKQCSHIDNCGCMCNQQSYCSTTTKPKLITENNLNCNGEYLHHQDVHRGNGEFRSDHKPPSIKGSFNYKVPEKTQKINVPPISTIRLRPVRQKTKNVIVSILSNGDVCLEFIKHLDGKDRVWEVMTVTSDGMRVILYQPHKGKGVPVADTPPPLPKGGADSLYSYENIPGKHLKKYSYAYKFVDLVKSKTPKITYYSSLAKCFLMENGPDADFEACFYKGGKVTKTQSRITLTEVTGRIWSFDLFQDMQHTALSVDSQQMWEHARKCLDHCVLLDSTMCSLSEKSEEKCFPLIIGRRPPPDS